MLHWLVEATEQLHAFTSYFLCEVHVQQVQLDEVYTVLSAVKDGKMSEDEAIQCLSRSRSGSGRRSTRRASCCWRSRLARARGLWPSASCIRSCRCSRRLRPLFVTDGFKEYMTALLTHFGHWVQPPRRQATGPAPKPRWMPLPQLLYAQVIKTMRRRRLVRVSSRVVFGTLKAVQQVLAACDWQINTAFVERLNLSLRQRVAAMGRRSATPCKSEDGLGQHLALFQVYHNFVLPHTSLPPGAGRCDTQGVWLSQGVAAVHARDGGGLDRSCLVTQRGTALPGATVATASRGMSMRWWEAAREGA